TLTATARATLYNGTVSNFSGSMPDLLPVAVDQDIWKNFLKTGDGTLQPDFNYGIPVSNAASTVPSPAVPNEPQIQVVPDPNGGSGTWNLLSLDSISNSNDNFKGWFSSGLTQDNLTTLQTSSQLNPDPLPLPAQPANPDNATYFWKGSPGIKGSSEPF